MHDLCISKFSVFTLYLITSTTETGKEGLCTSIRHCSTIELMHFEICI